MYEQIIDGQPIKLTKEQLDKVVYLGLVKASELSQGPVEESEKKEVLKEKEEKKDERTEVQLLKEELSKREQAKMFSDLEEAFSEAEYDKDFEADLKEKVIIQMARQVSQGKPLAIKKIVRDTIQEFNRKVEKYKPKVNISEKEKGNEKVKFSSAGKPAGEAELKPLGRQAFRDGTLVKRVFSHLENLVKD